MYAIRSGLVASLLLALGGCAAAPVSTLDAARADAYTDARRECLSQATPELRAYYVLPCHQWAWRVTH